MTAVFLTAAVQNMRRRMRIRKAIEAGSKDFVSTVTEGDSDADDISHLDGDF